MNQPDFSSASEMEPFRQQPPMAVGLPGKSGFLDMVFELDEQGKSILRHLERRVPLIVQQALYFDEAMPQMPCVYILSSGGPNVDGDRYEQRITLHKGAYAHISTGAATKLAEMTYNFSGLQQHFRLEEDAYLEFLPEPVIPCRHTRFISDTLLTVHPTATVCYAETYLSGRKYYGDGECFQYDVLSVCTRGESLEGEPLFREKMLVRPGLLSPCCLGSMDRYEVFANVVVLTPPEKAAAISLRTDPFIDKERQLAVGITQLPNQCGLLCKVLGMKSASVKAVVREFCSIVRQEVKGVALPPEFPWR